MTMKEASEQYKIPVKILKEYEKWELCGAVKKAVGAWQYDDQDIERLSLIMTLRDMGFNNIEVETYMRLTLEGDHTKSERIAMLNRRRGKTLDEIHFREKQIAHMDYLRHEMQKGAIELAYPPCEKRRRTASDLHGRQRLVSGGRKRDRE